MYRFCVFVLLIFSFCIWLSVFMVDDRLKVIACDVGQGDAILIQKNFDQILIDGGPNNKVLDCLGKYMPFWDRKIELLILSHPDSDHGAGVVDVLNFYKVENMLTNKLDDPIFSTQLVSVLQTKVGSEKAQVLYPSGTPSIRLGLIHLDILHPGVNLATDKTNDLSIVALLKYNGFEALFTGDIEDETSDELAKQLNGVDIDYLKVPHHGSKNGLSEKLLEATKPETAVISVGKDNRYGHPHAEVLAILNKYNLLIRRSDTEGDVVELKN